LAIAAQRAAHLPHLGAGDFAHRKASESMRCADHAADLVAALHLIVDFSKNVGRWAVAGTVGLLEALSAILVELLLDPEQPRRRYLLADGAGDALGRVEKGVVPVASARAKPTVETLANPVNSAEQDARRAKKVPFVFEFE